MEDEEVRVIDLHEAKRILLTRRIRFVSLQENLRRQQAIAGGISNPEDQAVIAGSRDILAKRLQEAVKTINLIDAALDRIGKMTYGLCSECGDQISARRLAEDATPEARNCLDCDKVKEQDFTRRSDLTLRCSGARSY